MQDAVIVPAQGVGDHAEHGGVKRMGPEPVAGLRGQGLAQTGERRGAVGKRAGIISHDRADGAAEMGDGMVKAGRDQGGPEMGGGGEAKILQQAVEAIDEQPGIPGLRNQESDDGRVVAGIVEAEDFGQDLIHG